MGMVTFSLPERGERTDGMEWKLFCLQHRFKTQSYLSTQGTPWPLYSLEPRLAVVLYLWPGRGEGGRETEALILF